MSKPEASSASTADSAASSASLTPPGGTLPAAWRLIAPFWLRKQNWLAWVYLLAAVLLAMLTTWLGVFYNGWNGRFMDALTHYNVAAVIPILLQFLLVCAGFVVQYTASGFVSSALKIQWRTWMTERFLEQWLDRDVFYRLEQEQTIDNPDQRITQDIDQLINLTYDLVLGLIGRLSNIVGFSAILWRLSGPLKFSLAGHPLAIPGYMFWLALVYALFMSGATHWVGRQLMALTFGKERAEANFRYQMVGVREHAEQIALYHGAPIENRRLRDSFGEVRKNFWRIIRFNLRLDSFSIFQSNLANLFPMLAALPRYFSHAITLGGMTQLSNAFGMVNMSLSWFMLQYPQLQNYRVVVARLHGLQQATRDLAQRRSDRAADGISLQREGAEALQVTDLALTTPSGRALAAGVSLQVEPGQRWLLQGDSGVGKSTLMRALAGIWPHGRGAIKLPSAAKLLFLSQKNYVPSGSLRAALCYPSEPSAFSSEACVEALQACRLGSLVDRLDEEQAWGRSLSPGEQQRLAMARALLQQPDYVFLDESTSALDAGTEQHLYQQLVLRLPNAGLISISHRPSLDTFHTHTLRVLAAADGTPTHPSPVATKPMESDMAELLAVTTLQGFEQDVLAAELPVLVDFWAPWCAPCLALNPVLEALAAQYVGAVRVLKLNADEHPAIASRYGVRGLPTVLVFEHGALSHRLSSPSAMHLRVVVERLAGSAPASVPAGVVESAAAERLDSFAGQSELKVQVLQRLEQASLSQSHLPSQAAVAVGADFAASLGLPAGLATIADAVWIGSSAQFGAEAARQRVVSLFAAIPVGVDLGSLPASLAQQLLHGQVWGIAKQGVDAMLGDLLAAMAGLHRQELDGEPQADIEQRWEPVARQVIAYVLAYPQPSAAATESSAELDRADVLLPLLEAVAAPLSGLDLRRVLYSLPALAARDYRHYPEWSDTEEQLICALTRQLRQAVKDELGPLPEANSERRAGWWPQFYERYNQRLARQQELDPRLWQRYQAWDAYRDQINQQFNDFVLQELVQRQLPRYAAGVRQ